MSEAALYHRATAAPRGKAAVARSAGYAAFMATGAALSFGKYFLLARWLPPEVFGQYAFLAAAVQYSAPIASLGVLDGFARRLPLLLGAGQRAAADRLRDACLGALAGIAGTAVLAASAAAMAVQAATSRPVTLTITLAACDVAAFLWFSFEVRDLRGRLHTTSFAMLIALRAALDLGAASMLGPRFGVAGLLAGEAGVYSLVALGAALRLSPGARPRLGERAEVVRTIREGGLIVAGGVAANTALMGDRLILGLLLAKPVFARYAVHLIVVTAATIVSNVVVQYVTPRLLTVFGRDGDGRAIFRSLARMSLGLAMGGMIVAPFVPRLSRLVMPRLFPAYDTDPALLTLLYLGAAIEVANLFPVALLVFGALRWQIALQTTAGVAVVAGLLAVPPAGSLVPYGAVFLAGRAAVTLACAAVAWRLARPSLARPTVAATAEPLPVSGATGAP